MTFLGGLDTVRGVIPMIALELDADPALEQRLRDPNRVRNDLDELIRLLSPVTLMGRTVMRYCEVSDAKLKAGDRVLVFFGSASRDAERFDNADVLEFDTPRPAHASFGLGVHRCLGMHLARLQLEIAFDELLKQYHQHQGPGPLGHVGHGHRADPGESPHPVRQGAGRGQSLMLDGKHPTGQGRAGDGLAAGRHRGGEFPTLLMVLVQLTGDLAWLEDPYRPARGRGIDTNDACGLPAEGGAAARPRRGDGCDSRLDRWHSLSAARSARRPASADAVGVDALSPFRSSTRDSLQTSRESVTGNRRVLGYADRGLGSRCAHHRRRTVGIGRGDPGPQRARHPLLDRRTHRVGGVVCGRKRLPGRRSRHPGPPLRPSFAPHDWEHYFALRSELADYFKKVSTDFDVSSHISFETEVLRAEPDPIDARWNVEVLAMRTGTVG